jgi:exodeoxyribonuclease VII large subunit
MSLTALDSSPRSYSLSELLKELKDQIDNKFKGDGFWVRGELSDWGINQKSGHYYGEIVEYANENSKQTSAKIRISMWSGVAIKLIPKFSTATGEPIKIGMKVLVYVQVVYHENYGLSLNITDIDPNFTLGDREARKKQILATLKSEGIIENNKLHPSPTDYTSVAVISSETAAGKGDFFAEADVLEKHGLCAFKMYPAIMQGSECSKSVAKSFRKIYSDIKTNVQSYDVIVVIRGGGSQADLDGFNHLTIAKAICHMPVPVFIGLGHQRDETVLDSITAKCFDTPSKVIGFIQNAILTNVGNAKNNFQSIEHIAKTSINHHKVSISHLMRGTEQLSKRLIDSSKVNASNKMDSIASLSKSLNRQAKQNLTHVYASINQYSQTHVKTQIERTSNIRNQIMTQSIAFIANEKLKVNGVKSNIFNQSKSTLLHSRSNIDGKYKGVLAMSIEPTLQRGFALTQDGDGKYITNAKDAKKSKELTITYHDGNVKTEVKKK